MDLKFGLIVSCLLLMTAAYAILGSFHLFFCSTFYFDFLPFVILILGIAIICALMRPKSFNKSCRFLSTLILQILIAATDTTLNSCALFCAIGNGNSGSGSGSDSVLCNSMKIRSTRLVSSCRNWTAYIFDDKMGPSPHWLTSLYISNIGLDIAYILLIAIVAYAYRKALLPYLNAYCFHIGFGVIAVIAGALHLAYCCPYFYVASGIWSGALWIVIGLLNWHRSNGHSDIHPVKFTAMMIVTTATAIILIGINVFGIFCWTTERKIFDFDLYLMHCEKSVKSPSHTVLYDSCINSLKSYSYASYPMDLARQEMIRIRLGIYIVLTISGLAVFIISLLQICKRK